MSTTADTASVQAGDQRRHRPIKIEWEVRDIGGAPRITDVTPPRFDDTSPAFTLDGKYLAFLSNRAFDPVYDTHQHDLGFLPGVRPYLVTLLATTPSPFGPELNGGPAAPEGPAQGPAAASTDTRPYRHRLTLESTLSLARDWPRC